MSVQLFRRIHWPARPESTFSSTAQYRRMSHRKHTRIKTRRRVKSDYFDKLFKINICQFCNASIPNGIKKTFLISANLIYSMKKIKIYSSYSAIITLHNFLLLSSKILDHLWYFFFFQFLALASPSICTQFSNKFLTAFLCVFAIDLPCEY